MKQSSEKSFGVLFFIVFILIALWPLLSGETIKVWALVLSIIFLVITFLKRDLLKPLNKIWIKFGELLGKIIAPIVMALIFFFILTPISIIIRLFGKDLLKLKISKDKSISKAIGVAEIEDFIKKKIIKDKLIEKISIKTRQYAKRQATWARGHMTSWKKIKPKKLNYFIKKI